MYCKYCNSSCIKKGRQSNGKQKYYCKVCNTYQQDTYSSKIYTTDINPMIKLLNNIGVGVRKMASALGVSPTTILRRLNEISKNIEYPNFLETNQSYEVDEMRIVIGRKARKGEENHYWLVYAINKASKQVVAYSIGRRTNEVINKVIKKLLATKPKHIYTDGLGQYKSLIPKSIHVVNKYLINTIERMHLTLRMDLKRLSKYSICYSRRMEMLDASLRIYFWG